MASFASFFNQLFIKLCYCRNCYLLADLRFSPPSATSCCNPSCSPDTNSFRWESSNTLQISSSLNLSNGSRFMRREPENSTGSCRRGQMLKSTVWRQTEVFRASAVPVVWLWVCPWGHVSQFWRYLYHQLGYCLQPLRLSWRGSWSDWIFLLLCVQQYQSE